MRKAEMSEQQLRARTEIIRQLQNAGWAPASTHGMFENGYWLEFEARMEYRNSALNLAVEYQAEKMLLFLSIADWLNRGTRLMLDCPDRLSASVDVIVAFQDAITPENIQEYIKRLLRVCPAVYVDLEDEMKRLVDKGTD